MIFAAVVGCGLRVAQWASTRTFSHDEITLLFSIRSYPLGRLLGGPLIRDQGAPVLWLAGERAALELFGPGEHAMRALPMAFACLGVVLVALLAVRVLSGPAALVGTSLFALSPLAEFTGWQVKPYSADAALAAGLLVLAVGSVRAPRWTVQRGLVWWGAAALAAVVSFPSVLLVAGVSLALVVGRVTLARPAPADDEAASGPRPRKMLLADCARFCLPAPLWLGAITLVYVLQLRHVNGLQDNYPMWLSGYAPTGGTFARYVHWVIGVYAGLGNMVWISRAASLVILLAVIGAVLLWRRDPRVLLVVAAPPVVALAAAFAHAYPLKGRLALWIVPALVILAAEAAWPRRDGNVADQNRGGSVHEAAWRRGLPWRGLPWRRYGPAAVAFLLLAIAALVPAARTSAGMTRHPERYDFSLGAQGASITELLDTVRQRYRPGDRLVAQDAYFNKALWYGAERNLTVDGVLAAEVVDDACVTDAYTRAAADATRLWFIGGESWHVTRPVFGDMVVTHLRALGHVTQVATQDGVHLYLVDLGTSPDARTAPPVDKAPCARFGVWKPPLP